mmetsp:Transcript_18004/g.52526  ORF Transcript_18004/g.52526 Transcript_18004/m.52526 type:complete len:216 (-) Transcript_18004:3907-4554(-)
MEESDAEEQLMPQLGLRARVPLGLRERGPGALKVCPDPLGRLEGHLDRVLQHRHGEVVHRHRCEPQAEVIVHIQGVGQRLDDLLQARHPRLGQVTVAQHDPVATPAGILDHLVSDWALALTQRDGLRARLIVAVGRKATDGGHRVGARGEHEDQGHGLARLGENFVKVQGRVLHILVAELLAHIVGAGENELLHAEDARHNKAAEKIKLRVPLSG